MRRSRGKGEETHHEQGFAERSRSFTKDLVRVEGDDVAEGEDEGVDVFHVEVVGGDRIGNRVLCEDLRLFAGVSAEESRQSGEGREGKEGQLTVSSARGRVRWGCNRASRR